jgi:two-component system sensor histidine kinase HydH
VLRLWRGRSLRGKFFRIVLFGVVIPLVALATWLRASAGGGRAGWGVTVAIIVVSGLALGASSLMTRPMASAIEELAAATNAVAGGDLDRRVSEERKDEIGRVGQAFNAMTESLRATLRALSQRESLVAVGEFAAALAHEVRNPLTSIRIDLQRVDEKLDPASPLRVHLGRALREVQRLDQTVSGALRIARSGSIVNAITDLTVPLRRAIEVATPAFAERQARLEPMDPRRDALTVRGDDGALEQLFLNILLNAAQALEPGGSAGVRVSAADRVVELEFWDTGPGITADRIEKVFEPFYSTKKDGTGLGLPVARQIVRAHGGTIAIDSAEDSGTTVSIRVPLVRG